MCGCEILQFESNERIEHPRIFFKILKLCSSSKLTRTHIFLPEISGVDAQGTGTLPMSNVRLVPPLLLLHHFFEDHLPEVRKAVPHLVVK